jgi:Leucine-rich repeat (LRR) protein
MLNIVVLASCVTGKLPNMQIDDAEVAVASVNPQEKTGLVEDDVTRIVEGKVFLYLSPDKDSDIMAELAPNTPVTVLDCNNNTHRKINDIKTIWCNIRLPSGQEGWVPIENIIFPGKTNFDLKYDNVITAADIRMMGINIFNAFDQLVEKMSLEKIEGIISIGINSIETINFDGIEKFIGLETICFKNCTINSFGRLGERNLRELSFDQCQIKSLYELSGLNSIYVMILRDCNIKSLSNLAYFQNMNYLNMEGLVVENFENFNLPNSLKSIDLSNFKEYKSLINNLPKEIEQIYLEKNKIRSLSEIEQLKNLPRLSRVFLAGNDIGEDEKMNALINWRPIELIWVSQHEMLP